MSDQELDAAKKLAENTPITNNSAELIDLVITLVEIIKKFREETK